MAGRRGWVPLACSSTGACRCAGSCPKSASPSGSSVTLGADSSQLGPWPRQEVGAPPAIGAHRLLGNGRSAALVTPAAEVDWWCAPTLDAPPILWSLLDPERARAGQRCEPRQRAARLVPHRGGTHHVHPRRRTSPGPLRDGRPVGVAPRPVPTAAAPAPAPPGARAIRWLPASPRRAAGIPSALTVVPWRWWGAAARRRGRPSSGSPPWCSLRSG